MNGFQIHKLLETVRPLQWTRSRLEDFQNQKLRNLVRFAKNNSVFWKDRLSNVDESNISLADLNDIPILTKEELMSNWDDIVTEPNLTLRKCFEHQVSVGSNPKSSELLLDGNLVFSTSGTTGDQAIIVKSVEEWELVNGLLSARWSLWDSLISSRRVLPKGKLVNVAGDSPTQNSGIMRRFTGTHSIPLDWPIERQIKELERIQPDTLTGHATALLRLAKATLEGNLCIAPSAIMNGGENLTSSIYTYIKKAWPLAQIIDGYGTTETGIMAFSLNDSPDQLYINEDYFIVEALADNNEPVDFGVTSDKVVVTCFESKVLPLLRYELSDRITLIPPRTDQKTCFRSLYVEGRNSDWFDWNGCKVHPSTTFEDPLTDLPSIADFQVHQTIGGADVQVVLDPAYEFNEKKLQKDLIAGLNRAGVMSPLIRINVVEEVSRKHSSGKKMRFVPLENSTPIQF